MSIFFLSACVCTVVTEAWWRTKENQAETCSSQAYEKKTILQLIPAFGVLYYLILYIKQGYTNAGRLVGQTIKICRVASITLGPSVWNFPHVNTTFWH